ncbi:hypothetical protein ElyMa_006314400 [Elysia marginata]|uniref:Uncharacterized protein n=1 Tax=Elysia marginata TaxID=1093978 RepID=A0AAV4HFW5_9GAST|nr:hypothetical protein ElyMa_006314400 [Elysia marginata]
MSGSRRSLDLMVALAVSPVEDKFPYNLFQTIRMPDAVAQFMKALLPVFDYLHTRVSVVGLDRTIGFSTASRYSNQLRQLTSGQDELISIASAYHLPTRVRPVNYCCTSNNSRNRHDNNNQDTNNYCVHHNHFPTAKHNYFDDDNGCINSGCSSDDNHALHNNDYTFPNNSGVSYYNYRSS